MTQEFENYNQLRVFSRPLTGVYLLFFLMVTLMILVGATWMGLYLAKRITRPVQMLAHAAREIGAGHLDQRIEPQSDDEFGALDRGLQHDGRASWRPAGCGWSRPRLRWNSVVATSKRFSSASRRASSRSTRAGVVTTINSAAARLLGVLAHGRRAGGAGRVRPARISSRSRRCSAVAASAKSPPVEREVTIAREGHEAHLTVVATPLIGDGGAHEGQILVLDDVTPLDPCAEGRCLARGRTSSRSRNQEPADADPAVGRAAQAPLCRRAIGRPRAGRGVHGRRSLARWSR